MSRGLALPIGVNISGGARLVERDEQADKIIFTALSDNDNQNAFQQDLGLGAGMIFDLQSPALRAKIIRKIVNIFRTFEQLEHFKLLIDTVSFSSNAEDGEIAVQFNYINLESDEVKTFTRGLSALAR